MSFFNETQREPAIGSANDISSGPRLGFLGAFEAAFDAQTRTESMYADAAAFDREEYAQMQRIRAAGLEPPPKLPSRGLWGVKQFEDVASYYNVGEQADAVAADLAARNQHIERLRKERPDLNLRTYDEMWSEVKAKAKAAESRWENATTTTLGSVGGFLGTVAGSMNPDTDPLNAVTLGVGGIGKRAVSRVATEALGQGAIEAVNQFTGVQGARERLGLDTSFERSAAQVTMVGLGGGALRAAGEGFGALGRRWFRDTPKDPAPPAPPPREFTPTPRVAEPARLEYPLDHYLGASRRAGTILDAELAHVGRQLDDGVPPWALKPATATALPGDILSPEVRLPKSTVEQLIERADPETWRLYAKLQDKADALRREIENVAKVQVDAAATAALRQLDEQIAALTATAQNTKGKKLAKLQADIATLEQNRAPLEAQAKAGSPETAARRQSELRQSLVRTDEQMRELALPMSRARAAAEGKFLSQQTDPEIAEMLRRNNPGSEVLQKAKWNEAPVERIDLSPKNLEAYVPRRPTDAPSAAPSQRAEAHAKQDAEAVAAQVEALDAFAKLPLEGETHVTLTNGAQVPVGTRLRFADADGNVREVSIKDWLAEVREDSRLLESVNACSLGKTS